MSLSLRAGFIRVVSPLVWWRPLYGARKLESFAAAEAGSMLELRAAIRACDDPQRQAAYLRHALDESRHAGLFSRRAEAMRREAGVPAVRRLTAGYEGLHTALGELGFLAFVHLAEHRGREQFEVYRELFEQRGDRASASMFEGILVDERRHEGYSWDLLIERAGSDSAAKRALRRVRLWEARRAWKRLGEPPARAVYTALMWLVYVLAAPLALLLRLQKQPGTGWQTPESGG